MKGKPHAPLVLLLRPNPATAVQLEWGMFLAAAGRQDLLILQREEDAENRVEEIALDGSGTGDTPVIVREVMQTIAGSDRVVADSRGEDDAAAETGEERMSRMCASGGSTAGI